MAHVEIAVVWRHSDDRLSYNPTNDNLNSWAIFHHDLLWTSFQKPIQTSSINKCMYIYIYTYIYVYIMIQFHKRVWLQLLRVEAKRSLKKELVPVVDEVRSNGSWDECTQQHFPVSTRREGLQYYPGPSRWHQMASDGCIAVHSRIFSSSSWVETKTSLSACYWLITQFLDFQQCFCILEALAF